MVEKHGKIRSVIIAAFYAMAVERGRKRNMVIPAGYIKQHYLRQNAPATRIDNPQGWVDLSKTKAAQARPFIAPALQSFKSAMPEIVIREVEKALAKAGAK